MDSLLRSRAAAGAVALVVASPFATAQDREPAFEVCVVGTIHAPWQFRWTGISPAHIRSTLAKLSPDVIGVESNPEWFAKGIFHEVTYEAQGVALPFAKKRGIPVYGVDWMDIPAWDGMIADHRRRQIQSIWDTAAERWLPTRMFGELSPAYLERDPTVKQFFFDKNHGFAHINQVDNDDYAKQWLKGDTTAADFGGRRNRMIVKRCVEAMAKHRGKLLVVVIGAGHKAVLDVLFARLPGVKVLRLGKDVAAPTAAEVAAAETAEDLVVAIGHNVDGERSGFHLGLIDAQRVRGMIRRLAKCEGYASHAHYFAARLSYLAAEHAAAAASLAKIGDQEPKAKLYPFPMQHWRMVYDFDQAVRIAKAELALEMEKSAVAGKHLEGLAEEIRLPKLPEALFEPGPLVAEIPATAKAWAPNGDALQIVEKTLFLVAEQKKKLTVGMAAVRHAVKITETGPLRIQLEVRARNRARGAVEIYERNPANGHMTTLGSKHFVTGPRWDPVHTDFRVRDTGRPIWIYVYLDAQVGTRFGVRNISVRKTRATKIPPDWIPKKLAREYVRTLLAH